MWSIQIHSNGTSIIIGPFTQWDDAVDWAEEWKANAKGMHPWYRIHPCFMPNHPGFINKPSA